MSIMWGYKKNLFLSPTKICFIPIETSKKFSILILDQKYKLKDMIEFGWQVSF